MSKLESPLSKIEHIVVVMLENRSFDNILGWLYDPGNPPPFNREPPANFDGLYGKELWNPGPDGRVYAGKTSSPTNPYPDPGEEYQQVYSQLYDIVPVPTLGQVPPEPTQPPPMSGFASNYALHSTTPGNIMQSFTPATLPVISSLAYNYGVCDHWFASIPTQTLCNRSFVYAGTSSGYVNNDGDNGVLFENDTTTIFNLLEEAGRSWRIYCASWLVTANSFLTQKQLRKYIFTEHFTHLDQLRRDASEKGGLPHYSFIEPIYLDSWFWGAENDMHPESWPWWLQKDGLSNVERGDALLYDIYTTLRASPDWDKILFVILFDEHGGCYDHVAPPAAIPPDNMIVPPSKPGGSGFGFDRLGVRIPAIMVSAYTPQQTTVNTVFDHTSVLSTVVNCFDLPSDRLGARAAQAPDVSAALSLEQPRTDKPEIPKPLPVTSDLQRLMTSAPLSARHTTIVAGAARAMASQDVDVEFDDACAVDDTRAADALMEKLEAHVLARRGQKPADS